MLASAPVLVHYNPELPLRVAGDASSYGIGAVMSHVFPDGTEHPVAFASRTLTSCEQNYAQLEKEALSLIFAINKFHTYLYGRKFTLITDNEPLAAILVPKKGVTPLAAARLQRWALQLSAYAYDVEFRSTRKHANADGLLQLPLPAHKLTCDINSFAVGQMQALPITVDKLRSATRQDAILSKILIYTKEGWPTQVPEECQPYRKCWRELSVEDSCLMWGSRVVIPTKL